MRAQSDTSIRIEAHKLGGGYNVFVGGAYIGDADNVKDAVRLAEAAQREASDPDG